MTLMHAICATTIAMNLPEIITFHGDSATVAEARNIALLGFTLDGARCVDQNVVSLAPEYGMVVNVVGLPDAESVSGWVLLLG